MIKRFLSGLLCLCMVLSLIPVAAFAADGETLFDRFIPINQAYSAYISPNGAKVGKTLTFSIGTRFTDETAPAGPVRKEIKRGDHQGGFLKVNYLGTYGDIDAALADTHLNLVSHDDYLRIIGDPSATERPADYYPIPYDLTKDTLVVSIDLYDENKELVQTISPASILFAVGEEGDFLTFDRYRNALTSIYFSPMDNMFKPDADKGTGGQHIRITPTALMLSDKSEAEGLLGSGAPAVETPEYEFIENPALTGTAQYDTNIILSDREFISPDGTYYQVDNVIGEIDPVVKNKIPNVVSYSQYGHVLEAGYTRRNLVTADGTLYGITNKCEKSVLATGVAKTTKNHYMTTDGTVKTLDGTVVVTDCKDLAEAYNDQVIGVLKNDNSFWMGYNYRVTGEPGFAEGLVKHLDNAQMVLPGAVWGGDGKFYRWHEDVIKGGMDEGAWSRGEFVEYNEYKLSLKKLCGNPVRVFPNERLTKIWGANQKDRDATINGFVVDADGVLIGYGIRYDQSFGKLGMVERIFPVYESLDNGNFVGMTVEGKSNPYAIVARYCDNNEYRLGEIVATTTGKTGYLCETQGGFKGADGNIYVFDNNPTYTSSKRFEAVTSSNFGQMHRKSNTFMAYNSTENTNIRLLPSIARLV